MCRANRTEMFRFETKQFTVIATIEPDQDVDISYDDTDETRNKLNSGEWQCFGTVVTVYCNGHKVGHDSLWGSIYADPHEFFTAHRDADPMNRNCSIMRALRGDNVCIGHYFPDMVREAISEARKTLATMPKLRAA